MCVKGRGCGKGRDSEGWVEGGSVVIVVLRGMEEKERGEARRGGGRNSKP